MISPEIITLIIIGVAILLLLSDRIRPDLVAILVLLSLGISGVLTPEEALSGFSRSAVITILAVFILAEGLRVSGLTDQLGSWLLKLAGNNETRLIIAVTAGGALLSLFMNNIAAAAVLLPAVMGAARKSGVNPSRLLIPLAFGTILGGMATLFTTTNIIASGLLRAQGYTGFGVLDFAPLGIPIVVAGVGFITLIGRRLLPERPALQNRMDSVPENNDLASVYQLKDRLVRAILPPGSFLVGKQIYQSGLRETFSLNAIGIERYGKLTLSPAPDTVLKQGDILLLAGRPENLSAQTLQANLTLLSPEENAEAGLESSQMVLVETVLARHSQLLGHSLRQAHFREKYNLNVIAIWRGGRPFRTNLSDIPLEFGDALLLLGPRSSLPLLRSVPDLVILSENEQSTPVHSWKRWLALAILVGSVLVASLSQFPTGIVMLAGAALMIMTGIISMDKSYAAVDWKAIFLIAGMFPLGIAISKTGIAENLGSWLSQGLGAYGMQVLLAGLVLLTMLLAQVMNGAAVSVMLVPVAIGAAIHLGADPRALVMGVALATSLAFITPFGHPVNILVLGPGGYHLRDYAKIGIPLTILILAILIFLLPAVWHLT